MLFEHLLWRRFLRALEARSAARLRKACEALGHGRPAGAPLMVGDSRNDVPLHARAGCPVVLVSYGYKPGEPAEVPAPTGVDQLDLI
jgi:phosphoglycolate phosphatase